MAFIPDSDLSGWASPEELDSVLRKSARLEARLESHTSPVVWITLGAIGGILYYVARQNAGQIATNRLASAIENAFI